MTLPKLLYRSGEISKMCGVSRKTWCAWVKDGYAPSPVQIGKGHRWLAEDIEKWIVKLKRQSK